MAKPKKNIRVSRRSGRVQVPLAVNEAMASVLGAYGPQGKPVPDISFATCLRGMCAGAKLDGIKGQLDLDNRCLVLTVLDSSLGWDSGPMNQPAHLELSDGSRVDAKPSHLVSTSMWAEAGQPPQVTRRFRLHIWRWATENRPLAWVGTIKGAMHRGVNLRVVEAGTGSQGLRLCGKYGWYLLGASKDELTTVVLDTHGETLSNDTLSAEFTALEFALGSPLQLDLLVGVDANLKPVAAFGPELGFRPLAVALKRAPVPDGYFSECWTAALFPRLARALASKDNKVHVATTGYLDSLADHLDGAYLKAQVALEAYSASLVKREDRCLVRDKKAWNRWVTSVDPKLKEHAITKEAAASLVGKVRNAMDAPSSKSVSAALQALGLNPPKEVLDEVKLRNTVAHEFVMTRRTPDHQWDVEAELSGVDLVRALIAIVVARSIGYCGPLLGWKKGKDHERLEMEWLPKGEEPEARHNYILKRGE